VPLLVRPGEDQLAWEVDGAFELGDADDGDGAPAGRELISGRKDFIAFRASTNR
jgi:hypothetical protein